MKSPTTRKATGVAPAKQRTGRNPRLKPELRIGAEQPFVLVNMAMTADGKTATANRAVSSIGSRRDAQHLLELRATADAVMAGARTVDLNRITMGPGPARYRRQRLRRGLAESNLRIIVSRSGSVNLEAEIFKHHFSPIIILTTKRASPARLRRLKELASEVKLCGEREIDFGCALSWLRKEWNVKRLLCEGGGELNDALFRAGCVDELHLTICPKIFGGRHAPTIADGLGAKNLSGATVLELKSARRFGDELFLVYRKKQTVRARFAQRDVKPAASRMRVRAARANPKGG